MAGIDLRQYQRYQLTYDRPCRDARRRAGHVGERASLVCGAAVVSDSNAN
jgi:hypothetical protein